MSRRILITGASVAGNTAAWWLGRAGFDVTVVERTPEFRDGGQNIDVRGSGRAVLRRMGLERAALDQGTGEEGTAWVEADGKIAAQFLIDDTGTDGPTAEMEILRGDLARLLYEPARAYVTYRFGDRIAGVEQDPDGVTVTFASGTVARYDAVIVAEGVGSATRELVFPGENEPRWMDLTIAYFTIPRVADDDRLWRWYNAPGGRSVSLRPDRHGTARAMLSVQQPPGGEQDWGVDRQKAWLRECFANAGWQTDRVLDGMRSTDDFYFDVLRQARMPRWSKGRVVLTGDAAWCATPIAGLRHDTGDHRCLCHGAGADPFDRRAVGVHRLRDGDAADGRGRAGRAQARAAIGEPAQPVRYPPAARCAQRGEPSHGAQRRRQAVRWSLQGRRSVALRRTGVAWHADHAESSAGRTLAAVGARYRRRRARRERARRAAQRA